ncbi:MFS general substrate transporter [Linderina pennispora]|uniref:MFS general substrate transporter n=1 Tax=Linderina pennispora TaxID=61395 RepID=A0A1Y1WKR2_9FUNG|nr:MFS general substrate transporter [Linderina pennispora]ORX74137.1 MFS general substrate transporter [Linderina pennispora]
MQSNTHPRQQTTLTESQPIATPTPDARETRTQLLSGGKLAMAIISLDLSMFLAAIDMTIVATTYVPIGDKFNSLDRAEWIISSYLIAQTAFQSIYGKISDVLGRVETMVLAIIIFLIGSILCAVSNSLNMLIASRVIQGIGGGGLVSMVLIVIADILNERQRGKYIGVFTGTWGLSAAIGPALGGVIVQNTKWQVIFWINIPICVISAAMIVFLLRIPRPKGSWKEKVKRIDFVGSFLSLVGITLILLALAWGGRDYEWNSVAVICCFVFGTVVIIACVFYEWKVPQVPIIPVRLFKIRNVFFSCMSHLFFGFGFFGPITFIPQWALVVKQASNITSGLYLLPFALMMVLGSVSAGIFTAKTGKYREMVWFGTAVLTLGNGLFITLDTNTSVGKVMGFMIVGGFGLGAALQTLPLAAQAAVTGKHLASITAVALFFRSVGNILAVSVLSNIIQNKLKTQIAVVIEHFPTYAQTILHITKDQSLINKASIPDELKAEIMKAYSASLRDAFIVLTVFTGISFLLSLAFKHMPLKTTLKKSLED